MPFRPGLDEMDKLALLERLQLLTAHQKEGAFDEISRLAARALEVPLALVSLVTDDEQVFVGMDGTLPEPWHSARATPLSHSFCEHVANTGKALIVPDAREHPMVRDNPAIRDLQVIAYLGVPLQTASGFTLGSFCAIDHQPRAWTERDVGTMRGLSALLMVEIESRLLRSQLQQRVVKLQGSEAHRNDRTRLLVHDLRTPLNSLLLGLSTVPLLGDLNQDQRDALDAAKRGGQTLVGLVDDMLDTAAADERGAGSLRLTRSVDPAELLAPATAQVVSLAAHRAVSLTVNTAGERPVETIDADLDKVTRALVNLLSNAIKFSPVGGRVELSMRQEEQQGERRVVFAVRDNGRGIAAEDRGRLFQRFTPLGEQENTGQRSSGLGLFFVKAVAEAHGGRLEVESESGRGSVFSLVLPCRQPR